MNESTPFPTTKPIKKNSKKFKPGIYVGLDFEKYCEIDAVNFSSLKRISVSPMHYRYTSPGIESPALAFGNLAHTGKLEPDLLQKHYIVLPDKQLIRNTQKWAKVPGNRKGKDDGKIYGNPKSSAHYKQQVKEFMQLHPGKQEVSEQWWKDLEGILNRLRTDKNSKMCFSSGRPEVSIVWNDLETNLLLKGRIDWVNDDLKIHSDLKTTANVASFCPYDLKYHWQAAMYRDGWKMLTKEDYTPWCVMAEKVLPYSVCASPYSVEGLKLGREEYRRCLHIIKKCRQKRRWPGPSSPKKGWEVPKWYKPKNNNI